MTNFIELTYVFFTDDTRKSISKRKIFVNLDALISVEPRSHSNEDDLVDVECNTLVTFFDENMGVVESYIDVLRKIDCARS